MSPNIYNEVAKKGIKNYLRIKHKEKLIELVLEGQIEDFLNKWTIKYISEIQNLEKFKNIDFENISEEELIAFNKDLTYQIIFDEIKLAFNYN